MKKLLLLFLVSLIPTLLFGQTKILEHKLGNVYSFISYTESGEINQQGYFYKMGDEYLKHGEWTHQNGQSATFIRGELQTITLQNGQTLTKDEIKYIRLIPKVREIEQKLITENN